MKNGFTLTETLISLVVIGIIAAILLPVLNSIRPDNGRVLYKKALYTMQNAISTAINDNTGVASNAQAFWADSTVQPGDFCNMISDTLNVVGTVSCGSVGSSSSPNFITSNGARWWGLDDVSSGKFTLGTGTNPTKTIFVDIDGSGGPNTLGKDQFRMNVRYDGRVTTDSSWTTENDYLSDSLKIKK